MITKASSSDTEVSSTSEALASVKLEEAQETETQSAERQRQDDTDDNRAPDPMIRLAARLFLSRDTWITGNENDWEHGAKLVASAYQSLDNRIRSAPVESAAVQDLLTAITSEFTALAVESTPARKQGSWEEGGRLAKGHQKPLTVTAANQAVWHASERLLEAVSKEESLGQAKNDLADSLFAVYHGRNTDAARVAAEAKEAEPPAKHNDFLENLVDRLLDDKDELSQQVEGLKCVISRLEQGKQSIRSEMRKARRETVAVQQQLVEHQGISANLKAARDTDAQAHKESVEELKQKIAQLKSATAKSSSSSVPSEELKTALQAATDAKASLQGECNALKSALARLRTEHQLTVSEGHTALQNAARQLQRIRAWVNTYGVPYGESQVVNQIMADMGRLLGNLQRQSDRLRRTGHCDPQDIFLGQCSS